MLMGLLASVLLATFLVVGLGGQAWLHGRRYGRNVLRGLERKPWTKAWYVGECTAIGFLAVGLGAVLDATGALAPLPGLNTMALEAAGLVMAICAFAATEWAVVSMEETWRLAVDDSEQVRLVTTGPFAIVRNPVYTGIILITAGLAVTVGNLLILAGCLMTVLGLELQVRVLEEPYLQRLHGADYDAYVEQVGRFLPGVGRRPQRADTGRAG